jgi:hypothetical protein
LFAFCAIIHVLCHKYHIIYGYHNGDKHRRCIKHRQNSRGLIAYENGKSVILHRLEAFLIIMKYKMFLYDLHFYK